jgi:branched-chain amino acid transport system substrate-binding protein
MNRSLAVIVVGFVCSAMLVVAGCGSSSTTASSSSNSSSAPASGGKGPIIIGAAIAETGPLSGYDTPATEAAQLAVNDINKSGGVLGRKLEIVKADTQSSKQQGTTAAQETISKGASIGLVTCDLDFGAPAAITFGAQKMVAMSLCAGSPAFGPLGVSPFAFTAGIATPTEGSAGAQFETSIKHWKTTYTLVDTTLNYDTTWMGAFQNAYKHDGGTIVGSNTFQNTDTSIASQITKIKALPKPPASITLCSYQPGGPAAVRQIRAAGITVPLMLCVGMDGTNWLPSVPGLSNTYVTDYSNYLGHDPNPAINAIYHRYVAAVGSNPPQGHFIEGYGAMQILAAGIKKAGTTSGPALMAALQSIQHMQVLTGDVTYTPKYHITFDRPVAIEQIGHGTVKFITKIVPSYNPPPGS